MTHTVGIRLEDKNKWERRVPIVPEDMAGLVKEHGLKFEVEPSPIRIFPDAEFTQAKATVKPGLADCGLVFAVKEIPTKLLRENGAYVYFSHTFKGQPYNMDMLRRLLELNCTLIDYEKITDDKNRRLIFFGRHAGLAGMIESFHALGQRLTLEGITPNPFAAVKQAYEYDSLEAACKEIRETAVAQLTAEGLPAELSPLVIGFAGYGNVSVGAQEIFDLFPAETVAPEELAAFITAGGHDNKKLYKTVFKEEHLVQPKELGKAFELQEYYDHPDRYEAQFNQYLPALTVLMNCIYWDTPYPRLVTKADLKNLFAQAQAPRLRVMGDITCDIDGSIECNNKATEPDTPCYVYEPEADRTVEGIAGKGPVIMAVDNLPCELPKEASASFSQTLTPFVKEMADADFSASFAELKLPDPIKKAVIVHKGGFAPDFEYMRDFV